MDAPLSAPPRRPFSLWKVWAVILILLAIAFAVAWILVKGSVRRAEDRMRVGARRAADRGRNGRRAEEPAGRGLRGLPQGHPEGRPRRRSRSSSRRSRRRTSTTPTRRRWSRWSG